MLSNFRISFRGNFAATRAVNSRPVGRSLILHRPVAWADPFPVRPGGTLLLAQMTFDTEADLHAALHSPARREARDDFHRFPPFEGEITHEAMQGKLIF